MNIQREKMRCLPMAGMAYFGGSSSSKSSNTTNNTDKRLVVGESGLGISADNSTLTTNTSTIYNLLDGGAVKGALDANTSTVNRALETVDTSNAMLGDNYSQLLESADKLFQRGETLIGQTQQHVADAYSQAQTDAKGTIDNRTIIVLAVAGAAALAFANRK